MKPGIGCIGFPIPQLRGFLVQAAEFTQAKHVDTSDLGLRHIHRDKTVADFLTAPLADFTSLQDDQTTGAMAAMAFTRLFCLARWLARLIEQFGKVTHDGLHGLVGHLSQATNTGNFHNLGKG